MSKSPKLKSPKLKSPRPKSKCLKIGMKETHRKTTRQLNVLITRTETQWHSIHGHGWSMAVPSLARPGPWMDQGWQSPLLNSC